MVNSENGIGSILNVPSEQLFLGYIFATLSLLSPDKG
jgi:hypothetical protein